MLRREGGGGAREEGEEGFRRERRGSFEGGRGGRRGASKGGARGGVVVDFGQFRLRPNFWMLNFQIKEGKKKKKTQMGKKTVRVGQYIVHV